MRYRILSVSTILFSAALLVAGCDNKANDSPDGSGGATATSTATTASTNGAGSGAPTGSREPGKKITVCLLPKTKGSSYFTACSQGAREAAQELGDVNLIYDGPMDGSAEKAAGMIEKWTLQGVDVIATSPNNPEVLAPAMNAARKKGVHVITFDADGKPGSREFFVNQASSEQIGTALVDTLAKDIGGSPPTGKIAIITATITAANQNEWIKYIKVRLKKYPKLQLIATEPSNDIQAQGFHAAQDLMKANPDLKGILAITSIAFPAAAEAVKQAGKVGKVMVTGLATPNDMKAYVMDGTVKSVILWNTRDLGALTITAAEQIATGKLKPGATSMQAGKLGTKQLHGDNIMLGDILLFNKDNIGKYNF